MHRYIISAKAPSPPPVGRVHGFMLPRIAGIFGLTQLQSITQEQVKLCLSVYEHVMAYPRLTLYFPCISTDEDFAE